MIAIVMGVSGCGKTTVAKKIAEAFDCQFQEGDALHPEANVAKMRAGTPLTDDDRWPWLEKIAAVIDGWRAQGQSGVLTCSALKRAYRDVIIGARRDVRIVYLKGSKELIAQRVAARHHDYMPASLLDSQFATLQEPTADENPVIVDISGTKEETAAQAIEQLRRQG
ncbi:MAG TPA: gluconokinase [Magnetospirillaceae bacterium]|jgi:carbohydrate kinase (thermoresistant glucokinase family)